MPDTMLSASLMGSQQYHSLNTLDLYLSENDSAVNNHAGVNEAVCSTGTLVDTFVLEPAAPHTTTSTSLLELSKAPGKEINADLVFLEDRPNEICLYTLHGKPCKHPALCDFEYKICIVSIPCPPQTEHH